MTSGRSLPLAWVSRDGKVIILARSVRTFAQGSIAVLFAVYLDMLGFSLTQIGVFFSFGVAGAAFFAFLVSLIAEKAGRRRTLIALTLMTAAAGVVMVLTDDVLVLTAFAFLGYLSGVGGGGGAQPTQPMEQASLADAASDDRRTDLFAVYGIVSTSAAAVGALAAGLPDVIQGQLGLTELAAFKAMFIAFVVLLVAVALLYGMLSSGVEARPEARHWVNPLTLPSRRIIFTLAALFSVDHFAGSLLLQSLVAYWFNTRFGLELGTLALVFFFSHVLAATLVVAGCQDCRQDWAHQHNGVHPHPGKPVPDSRRLCAHSNSCGAVLAAALLPESNGRAYAYLVYDGGGRAGGAGGHGRHTHRGEERFGYRRSGDCDGPLAGGLGRRSADCVRGVEDSLRHIPLLHVPQREASGGGEEGREGCG